jgi:hypothetical protein
MKRIMGLAIETPSRETLVVKLRRLRQSRSLSEKCQN